MRVIFLLVTALLLAGCASRVPTGDIRDSISAGNVDVLREKMQESRESFDDFVTTLNLARLLQLEGNWKDSIRRYDDALAILEAYEARAQINVRELVADTGTILLARGAKPYYGTGYERSLLHTFNAINYVMLGDFSGAAVEMRKMEKRQEYWLQESDARIEENLKEGQRDANDLPIGYSMRDVLQSDAVRNLMNNYQDAFSYALSAIVLRIAGDVQAADVSMRRAIVLDNQADALFRRAWTRPRFPQGAAGKPESLKTARKKAKSGKGVKEEEFFVPPLEPLRLKSVGANGAGQVAQAGRTQEVTVIAFSGLAPALKVEHVRTSVPRIGYILLDLPAYTRAMPGLTPYGEASSGAPLVFYPLLHTDRLAYRTLQDEVGFELGSAISRAAVRAGIAASVYAGTRSSGNGPDAHDRRDRNDRRDRSGRRGGDRHRGGGYDQDDYAEAASLITMMLLDWWTYSISTSVRNWETLPNVGYIAMTTVPHGSVITVGEGGGRQSLPLPNDSRGVIIMLTVFSNARMRMDYVTY